MIPLPEAAARQKLQRAGLDRGPIGHGNINPREIDTAAVQQHGTGGIGADLGIVGLVGDDARQGRQVEHAAGAADLKPVASGGIRGQVAEIELAPGVGVEEVDVVARAGERGDVREVDLAGRAGAVRPAGAAGLDRLDWRR